MLFLLDGGKEEHKRKISEAIKKKWQEKKQRG